MSDLKTLAKMKNRNTRDFIKPKDKSVDSVSHSNDECCATTSSTSNGQSIDVGNFPEESASLSCPNEQELIDCSLDQQEEHAGSETSNHRQAPDAADKQEQEEQPQQQEQEQQQGDEEDDQDQIEQPKKRCDKCGKKLGLTGGFPCRCGGTFCAFHRYSDRHECNFDYREMGASEIRRDNPVIIASKLRKL